MQTWFPKDATTHSAMTGSPSSPKHNSLSSLRSTLFLNSVSQSTHEITKLVPQARMLLSSDIPLHQKHIKKSLSPYPLWL